jgi:proteasome lid subunit RPN8/RPN11
VTVQVRVRRGAELAAGRPVPWPGVCRLDETRFTRPPRPHHGPRAAGGVQVLLDRAVWYAVREHACSSTDEVAGILCGWHAKDDEGELVLVGGSVRCAGAAGTRTQVNISPTDLNDALDGMAERFPGQELLGWYHTHPALGVFFSAQDAATHRAMFPWPRHIGLVLDPVAGDAGVFVWTPAGLSQRSGFLVYEPSAAFHDLLGGSAETTPLAPTSVEVAEGGGLPLGTSAATEAPASAAPADAEWTYEQPLPEAE